MAFERKEPVRSKADSDKLVVQWKGLPAAAARSFLASTRVRRERVYTYQFEQARDDAADALMRAAELWRPGMVKPSTGSPVAFSSYAWTAAWNKMLSGYKKARRRADREQLLSARREEELPSREPDPLLAALRADTGRLLRRMLRRLPRPERSAMLQHYWHGKTFYQIGKALGVTRSRVGQIMTSARYKLEMMLRLRGEHGEAP